VRPAAVQPPGPEQVAGPPGGVVCATRMAARTRASGVRGQDQDVVAEWAVTQAEAVGWPLRGPDVLEC